MYSFLFVYKMHILLCISSNGSSVRLIYSGKWVDDRRWKLRVKRKWWEWTLHFSFGRWLAVEMIGKICDFKMLEYRLLVKLLGRLQVRMLSVKGQKRVTWIGSELTFENKSHDWQSCSDGLMEELQILHTNADCEAEIQCRTDWRPERYAEREVVVEQAMCSSCQWISWSTTMIKSVEWMISLLQTK